MRRCIFPCNTVPALLSRSALLLSFFALLYVHFVVHEKRALRSPLVSAAGWKLGKNVWIVEREGGKGGKTHFPKQFRRESLEFPPPLIAELFIG